MNILTTAAIGAGVIAVTLLAIQLLPQDVTVTRSAQVDASPSDLIALLASNEGYQKINPIRRLTRTLKSRSLAPQAASVPGFILMVKRPKAAKRWRTSLIALSPTTSTWARWDNPRKSPKFAPARVAAPGSSAWRLISATTQLCAFLGYS